MSRRTLNQERQLLVELSLLMQKGFPDEIRDDLAERMGVAAVDQLGAAAADAKRLLEELRVPFGFGSLTQIASGEVAIKTLGGVIRCMATASCEHAATGGRPLYAMLSARVIACRECLPRFLSRVAAADRRNALKIGDGRICDFCLNEPDDFWFRQTAIQFGPAIVTGDMCVSCCREAEKATV